MLAIDSPFCSVDVSLVWWVDWWLNELKLIGIDLELIAIEFQSVIDFVSANDFDLINFGSIVDFEIGDE